MKPSRPHKKRPNGVTGVNQDMTRQEAKSPTNHHPEESWKSSNLRMALVDLFSFGWVNRQGDGWDSLRDLLRRQEFESFAALSPVSLAHAVAIGVAQEILNDLDSLRVERGKLCSPLLCVLKRGEWRHGAPCW